MPTWPPLTVVSNSEKRKVLGFFNTAAIAIPLPSPQSPLTPKLFKSLKPPSGDFLAFPINSPPPSHTT